MTDRTHGFPIEVYRGRHEGTNGGVSSKADRLTVVGVILAPAVRDGRPNRDPLPEAVSPLDPEMRRYPASPDAPAVVLVADHVFGDVDQPRLRILPAFEDESTGGYRRATDTDGWVMFGGNFAHAGDSRWTRLVCEVGGLNHPAPVAVHDRVEAWRR